jgi:hypothetical protein
MWSVSQVSSHSSKGSGGHSGEIKFHLVDVTPAPIFARLKRLHDGMLSGMEMLRRMFVLGRITATDMAAHKA